MIQTTMETMLFIRTQIKNKLHDLMEGHDVGGHGFDHFIAVGNHAVKALEYEDLSNYIKLQIELAAYLHDVDDPKIFPNSINYQNARKILNEIFADINFAEIFPEMSSEIKSNEIIDGIIQMIEIVSCSKNGDSEPPERWMAIPRDCDRLEAIGKIGIQRCYEYTLHTGAALHNVDTPKVHTNEELWKIATQERFEDYKKIKKSASMIDHYYDKLLHIGKAECLRSQNKYILEEAANRNHLMMEFVLDYWKTEV